MARRRESGIIRGINTAADFSAAVLSFEKKGGAMTDEQFDRITFAGMTDHQREVSYAIALALMDGTPGDDSAQRIAILIAADAIKKYRRELALPAAREKATALPVRKAVPAGTGGGRYYWRIAAAVDGAGAVSIVPAVSDIHKHKGTRQEAIAQAVELFVNGGALTPVELVPPDYDPVNAADEQQRNTANFQPGGMTVRQRTKKH